jgi:hypothetical protein
MYGEFFDIPPRTSWSSCQLVHRRRGVPQSGCTFRRGHGKIFYFSPGDQDYPVYHHKDVRRVIANGVEWAHRPAGAGGPDAAALRDRRLLQRSRLHRDRSRSPRRTSGMPEPLRVLQVGAGGDGPAWLATDRRRPRRRAGRPRRPRPGRGPGGRRRARAGRTSRSAPTWSSSPPETGAEAVIDVTVPRRTTRSPRGRAVRRAARARREAGGRDRVPSALSLVAAPR